MDEIKTLVLHLMGSNGANVLYYQKHLLEAIQEYGEDQWARGHEVGKEDGFESAYWSHKDGCTCS